MRALMALVAVVAPLPTEAQDPISFNATYIFRGRVGPDSCSVKLEMVNTLDFPVKASGTAYLVTTDKTTLGQDFVLFPTAVGGGKSLSSADFSSLGQPCPAEFDVRFVVDSCRIEGVQGFAPKGCKGTYVFPIKQVVKAVTP